MKKIILNIYAAGVLGFLIAGIVNLSKFFTTANSDYEAYGYGCWGIASVLCVCGVLISNEKGDPLDEWNKNLSNHKKFNNN